MKIPPLLFLIFFSILGQAGSALAGSKRSQMPCFNDVERQKERSAELQKIMAADQDDRKSGTLSPDVPDRDAERRKRVGAIFGEGCFRTAKDYEAAAMVFQHGDHPDHYFQTFIWSKRGVELGDASQKTMMALAIDRYLVSMGYKQLFATQAFQITPDTCFCLQPVELSFPDSRRKVITGRTLKDAYRWVKKLNKGRVCKDESNCMAGLQDSPPGTVPGYW